MIDEKAFQKALRTPINLNPEVMSDDEINDQLKILVEAYEGAKGSSLYTMEPREEFYSLSEKLMIVESAINEIIIKSTRSSRQRIQELAMSVGPMLPHMVKEAAKLESLANMPNSVVEELSKALNALTELRRASV
jgi:hypothetical protein